MSKTIRKPQGAAKPKTVEVFSTPGQSRTEMMAQAVLKASFNGAVVIEAYQGNLMGNQVEIHDLVDGLRETCKKVEGGDLATPEAMLLSQATALQTIFTSLARRAATQEHMRQYEAFLGLALKAQAQSRATISALVDLKYPRQATFVKQANIAHGPQQVNNGQAPAIAPAKENEPERNKLIEDKTNERTYVDSGATPAAKRSNQAVEAVGKINRAKKP